MPRRAFALLVSLSGCQGPVVPEVDAGSGDGSDSGTGSDSTAPAEAEAPPPYELTWEAQPVACGVVEQVRTAADGTLLLAGSRSIIYGWVARYDDSGGEQWLTESDTPFRALDENSAGFVWAVGEDVVAAFEPDGTPSVTPASLDLPADVDLGAVAFGAGGWFLGGSIGEFPADAFLSHVDTIGQELRRFDTPPGNGNVPSEIADIDSGGALQSLSAACGVEGSGEWGHPWLQVVEGDTELELQGEGEDGLGVRTCADVAVFADELIARAESGAIGGVVVTDDRGELQWEVDGLDRPTAVGFLPDGGVVVASSTALHRITADGTAMTTTDLEIGDTPSVRDLAVLPDGSVVLAGYSDVNDECAQAWLARYE